MYVVGAEQKQHFQMVFAAARIAGFLHEEHTSKHVPFGLVLGSDGGKLKSRSGGAIRLLDLLQEAIQRASAAVSDRNPGMDSSEIESIAKSIGIGAVKYSDLKAASDERLRVRLGEDAEFRGRNWPISTVCACQN